MLTIIETMRESALFARWFKDPTTWLCWGVFLSALFGLPIDPEWLDIFKQCTGRTLLPAGAFNEAWLIVGRRGGKSIILALVAVFLAVFKDWSGRLVPGERGTVLVIAADRRQARVIFRYITALITETPMIASLVDGEVTQERIDLTNGISIEISTANFRSVRGYTLVAALCDEIAFWQGDDSANPDTEILAALRPAMSTLAPDAMLLCASSPYAQKGALYEAYKKHYGRDDAPVLVWKASTRTMNPSVPASVVDEAYERDAAAAAAEHGAEFRSDLITFVDPDVVARCVVKGRLELPPTPGIAYTAGIDPSGGSSDSMTLAIAHPEGDRGVLDFVREWPAPFSPEKVVTEIVEVLRRYGVTSVIGDRYAGEWAREPFRTRGIEYKLATLSRSDCYLTLLPSINSGKIELLDNKRLVAQLCGLERRTARSGKDTVDHPSGSNYHDDVINAAALALVGAALTPRSSADNWLEYMRRELARAGIDRDDIRPPSFGYQFNSANPEPLVKLIVPRAIEMSGGNSVVARGDRFHWRFAENRAYLELPRGHALEVLQHPIWRAENPGFLAEESAT